MQNIGCMTDLGHEQTRFCFRFIGSLATTVIRVEARARDAEETLLSGSCWFETFGFGFQDHCNRLSRLLNKLVEVTGVAGMVCALFTSNLRSLVSSRKAALGGSFLRSTLGLSL